VDVILRLRRYGESLLALLPELLPGFPSGDLRRGDRASAVDRAKSDAIGTRRLVVEDILSLSPGRMPHAEHILIEG
jgi:hypothetical protein